MIPKLTYHSALSETLKNLLSELRHQGFQGDIETQFGARIVGATDNSIYQIVPDALCFPKTSDDIALLLTLCSSDPYRDVAVTPRGGGTGTNGQSLNSGLIVDVSRHMNQILEIQPKEKWARVQPGVVLDQLNASLKSFGLFFAPDLSPSSRATIGGMVGTDACGKGSRVYGKTSDHILKLELILSDGSRYFSEPCHEEELDKTWDKNSLAEAAVTTVRDIARDKKDLIKEKFPDLTRFLSGYNLNMVRDDSGNFNLNYLISGSEGTLAFTSEIKVKLTPLPKHKALVVVKYPDFSSCLSAAQMLLKTDPAAIETIDDTILKLARDDVIWHKVSKFFSQPNDDAVGAVNLLEFIADSETELAEQLQHASRLLEDAEALKSHRGYQVAHAPEDITSLWSLRKKGVGLLGNRPGNRRPIAFVEDTVVPPENLAAYIKEFRALLDSHNLDYGMFGHVDVGCLHVRPALDIKSPEDEALVRKISDGVKDLVLKYGGVIWGEHGKGLRSEYMPEFFGEELYQDLRRIKGAFDPENRLNPGKICCPIHHDSEVTKLDEVPMRGSLDRQILPELQETFGVSMNCNGNAACFNYSVDDVMCPSYKITREKLHSPKGRAGMLREWARQLSEAKKAQPTTSGQDGGGDLDFSREVYEALDGCLSCKGCTHTCPIKVDIPEQKSRFLEHYHTRYPRPLKDKFFARGERIHYRLLGMPRIHNSLISIPGVKAVMKHVVGLVDLPKLSVPNYKSLARAESLPLLDLKKGRPSLGQREAVILLPDAITSFYEAEVFIASAKFIRNLGVDCYIGPFINNGKALHVKGFLSEFRSAVAESMEVLEALNDTGAKIVGMDPAITLTYREEYPRYTKTKVPQVYLLHEWLSDFVKKHPVKQKHSQSAVGLFNHCGESSAQPGIRGEWQRIFKAFGLDVKTVVTGCCGMAGAFGHERHHESLSKSIFEQNWASKLNAFETILATGASCRTQMDRIDKNIAVKHPLEWLSELKDA
ncbi:MAG: FAD-binding oxidoreductase [Pseudobacteriovorax sp.]|nr:FAD-binding oxidoreductase [Pseudobacteriovorax sp.]